MYLKIMKEKRKLVNNRYEPLKIEILEVFKYTNKINRNSRISL